MTTTTSTYLSVAQNLARYQTSTGSQATVKTASAYYAANIAKVTSVADFVANYRLLSYALDAYGLSDQINSKALVTKVLQGGVTDSKSLANTLTDSRWRAFAKAFDFVGSGAASVSTSQAVQATAGKYVESRLESDQGSQNVGVQLALYFQRVAPTVTSTYGILADPNLLQVVQTIFSLPASAGSSDLDTRAAMLNKLVPLKDLQNAKTLQQLTSRFTAMYDVTYGPSSNATTSLKVSGGTSSTQSAAAAVLAGIVSSNSTSIGGTAALFSNQILTSLQGLRLGG